MFDDAVISPENKHVEDCQSSACVIYFCAVIETSSDNYENGKRDFDSSIFGGVSS